MAACFSGIMSKENEEIGGENLHIAEVPENNDTSFDETTFLIT